MKDYYTYQETLDIVEKFMIETGVREYCETICKGKCCCDCYDSDNACFKNERRRLPCSAYICYYLQKLLNLEVREAWRLAATEIERKLKSSMGLLSCYFNVNTPKVQKAFKIQKSLIDNAFQEKSNIETVGKLIRGLIENKTQVR